MEKEKEQEQNIFKDFDDNVKREIIDIINDSPTLVMLGDKEFAVKDLRYYTVYRICRLALDMKQADATLDDDNKVITALCTDLSAMCEIMALILCNHWFRPDHITDYDSAMETMSRNDKMVEMMKAKVMNSTFEINQWGAIVIGALKSIDLTGFFLLKKSVSMLTDSLMMRKRKQEEIASQFMEALSLQTQPTG